MSEIKAFTLLELIVTIIIIGILASIALPNYTKAMERSRDQEAITNLKLIKAAERIYLAENNSYFGPQAYDGGTANNETAINTNLHLYLPADVSLAWNYYISSAAAGPPPTFTAVALRNAGGFNRTWTITEVGDQPICNPVPPSTVCP
ncbi:MAG: prepilin-type N-terminal cleavage/methylation domain-containing protein [Candidatus Omnitrophota bacterium]|nr:prepilin-type N-terminal cleavage/methylation domain-containing protein [Candidatus Omnitrophota bacterium]